LALLLQGSASARAWDEANDPRRLLAAPVAVYAELPRAAQLPPHKRPYADHAWPYNRGGIAFRWNSPDPAFRLGDPRQAGDWALFQIEPPTREQAARLSASELAQLSPAEKYDLARGRYDYPLTRSVLDDPMVNPFADPSSGICHGSAPAAIAQAEPQPVVVRNPDGIDVPFATADVKALLAQAWATARPRVAQVGRPCLGAPQGVPDVTGCLDINAGAFHIILANLVGLRQQGFVADLDAAAAIWNYPIQGYASEVVAEAAPDARSASGTVRRLQFVTTLSLAPVGVPPQWDAQGQEASASSAPTAAAHVPSAHLDYWLELDAEGRILGGEWSSDERPDYVWLAACPDFSAEFAELARIYRPRDASGEACKITEPRL
jgi:hypothetical protein